MSAPSRRGFLGALPVIAAGVALPVAASASVRRDVLRIILLVRPDGRCAGALDATARRPIGHRFPLRCEARVRRSFRTGKPVMLSVRRIQPNGSNKLRVGEGFETEPVWVLCVGIETESA